MDTSRRAASVWEPAAVALAGIAVYANSFRDVFVFDDFASIRDNLTLRTWWKLGTVLHPPSGGLTVSGRPVLNLTLALNYAAGGTHVAGYHAVNLLIHVLCGLLLLGVARRAAPAGIAFALALLWTVHPLQTEAVTYVVQRAESLMAFFYLLTLYAYARGWGGLAVLACLLGMGTKENMVSAPVVVLLYDRAFLSGSFAGAWRRHGAVLIGLFLTWLPLAWLVLREGGSRSGSVGFGAGVLWGDYVLTQFQAIAQYLRLSVWPRPLVFDYGTFWVRGWADVLPAMAVVLGLLAATGHALARRPAWGFLGAWFFAILAPTSLLPGTTQMIVEHRMYLALAPVLAVLVVLVQRLLRGLAWPALLLFAGFCAALTIARNRDYRSEIALWQDTVCHRPQSALAHNNLGAALARLPGHGDGAIREYREALRLDPRFHEAYNNLGNALAQQPGKGDEAIAQYREALRLRPDFAEAHNDLGDALARAGRRDEAVAEYQAALHFKPNYAGAHYNLGNAWLATPGRLADAAAEFETAVQLDPDFAEARNNLGNAWLALPGRANEGRAEILTALRLRPDLPEAHNNLANALAATAGGRDAAIAEYREALRLRPDYPEARFNLAAVLVQRPEGIAEARRQLETYLRERPGDAQARRLWDALQGAGG